MIHSLYIKDFALIDELEVTFQEGLNILTGQTGAGKSIIIGALNMVLGERADTEVIRQGADKAIAEAILKVDDYSEFEDILEENAVELRPELILRREIRSSGSRAFINDTPVTLEVLRRVGEYLMDVHSQHDTLQLGSNAYQLSLLDAYAQTASELERYQLAYRQLRKLQQKQRHLGPDHADVQTRCCFRCFTSWIRRPRPDDAGARAPPVRGPASDRPGCPHISDHR